MSNDIQKAVTNAIQPFATSVDLSLNSIKEDIADLKKDTKNDLTELKRDNKDLDAKLEVLRADFDAQRETLKEDIKTDLREEFKGVSEAAHKADLIRLIDRTSANIVLHGYKSKEPKKDTQALFNSICKEETVEVKNARTVGGAGNSIVVTLGSEFERNTILKESRHLPAGVSVDKDVPMIYRNKYSSFKREAWKQRQYFGFKTQISFSGHLLQLRYKEEGKGFVLLSEFSPSVEDALKQHKTTSDKLPPSKIITPEDRTKASKSLIVNNPGGKLSVEDAKLSIAMIIPKGEMGKIESVDLTFNKNILVTCINSAHAKQIAGQLNKRSAGDFEFKASAFDSS
jgi:hypothetical protein